MKKKMLIKILIIFGALLFLIFLISVFSVFTTPKGFRVNIDATPNQILKLKTDDVRAILIIGYYGPETNYDIGKSEGKMLIGNPDEFERITGEKYTFTKVMDSGSWVARIHYKYKYAIKEGNGQLNDSDARVIFITEKKGYMMKFAYDDKAVYNEYLRSEELWEDLDSIGFIEHEKPVPVPKLKKLK